MRALFPSFLAVMLAGAWVKAAAPSGPAQGDASQEAAGPSQDDFQNGTEDSAANFRKSIREIPAALPPPVTAQNPQAVAACVKALRAGGLGVPDHFVMACGGVQDPAGVEAVVGCYKKLDASGTEPKYFAAACNGVRDADAVEGLAACQAKLKSDGADSKYFAAACNGVRNVEGAEAVASCHQKLGAMGEDPIWHAWACKGVRDANGVEAVAACHSKLKTDGVEFKYFATACNGVQDMAGAGAVSSCMRALGATGEDPIGLATACKGVRDARGVAAVAACHSKLKAGGVDPRFLAVACNGVSDGESAEAVAACHGKLRAMGENPFYHAVACNGVKNADGVEAVAACHKQFASKGAAAGYSTGACRGAQVDRAAPVASAGRQHPSNDVPSSFSYYATVCTPLPAWLKDVPDSEVEIRRERREKNSGEFDAEGAIFIVSARAPKTGEKLIARDLARNTAALRVSRTLDGGFQVRAGGKLRTLRLCSSPAPGGAR